MFKKLRLKLTLTNVIVVSIMFLIFILGVFLVMEKMTEDHSNQLVNLISSDAGLSNDNENSKHNNHNEKQYRYFYVKLNLSNDIINTSQGLDINNKHIKSLISKALSSSKNKGRVSVENEPYHFEKNNLKNEPGISIVFVNTHSQHQMMDDLFAVLIVSGIFGLILAFLGVYIWQINLLFQLKNL